MVLRLANNDFNSSQNRPPDHLSNHSGKRSEDYGPSAEAEATRHDVKDASPSTLVYGGLRLGGAK
jgi:hypothetical protein